MSYRIVKYSQIMSQFRPEKWTESDRLTHLASRKETFRRAQAPDFDVTWLARDRKITL